MQSEMNNTNTTTTPAFDSFVADVKQWTLRNFGEKQNPFIGMVEELGELSRCVIKRQQGIRGFSDPKFFEENYFDAVGDIGVYSANFAFRYDTKAFWPTTTKDWTVTTHNEHIAYACKWLACLGIGTLPGGQLESKSMQLSMIRFLEEIDRLAVLEGGTLRDATLKTWSEVQNRNWTQNPENGKVSQ